MNTMKKRIMMGILAGVMIFSAGCKSRGVQDGDSTALQEYRSADKSLTIQLPGDDWQLDEDSDELRIFSSAKGLVMLTHTENAAGELYPQSEADLGMILDIEGYASEGYEVEEFQKTEVGDLKSYQATIHYTEGGSMYRWGILYGNLIGKEVYMASAMLIDDDQDMAQTMKSCLLGYVWDSSEPDAQPDEKEKASQTPTQTATPQTEEPTTEVTEEPTPEVTAEPTPEAVPEVTAEPTPEAVPEVTAEPTPEAVPEVTQQPIMDNTVTPISKVGYCHSSAFVRSAPNNQSEVVGTMEVGTDVTITGEVRNWYQISYNGATAYICKDYIQ